IRDRNVTGVQTCALPIFPDACSSGASWTRRLLKRHLGERLGCFLSRASMTRLIGALGFVWTRPKLTVKASDPEGEEREAAVAAEIGRASCRERGESGGGE